MKIVMITPAPPRSRFGNRVTATRWRNILTGLGHRVRVSQTYGGEPCDLMIALHARRSHDAMKEFQARFPGRPIVLALTGTDVYRDIADSPQAVASLHLATRMVTLQPLAAEELPRSLRGKVRVILQSAPPLTPAMKRRGRGFLICVIGHLREEKDPFRAAAASRALPASSRITVVHAGKAMNEEMEAEALAEQQRNSRYRWLGEVPRWRVRRLLGASRLMVLSSRMEGGANAISEAAAAELPVLASHIPGSVGLLGRDYPGYFPVGHTEDLRRLLERAEGDAAFLASLDSHILRLAPAFQPVRETEAWRKLLTEMQG